jgi:hypothetical protein
MYSTLTKEEKTTLFFGLGIVAIAIIVDSYMRNKNKGNESGYVQPRGFFQQPVATTPTPPATPSTPSGREVAPPTPSGREVAPPMPSLVGGESYRYPVMPYPYPMTYGIIPYSIIPNLPPTMPQGSPEMAKSSCYKSVVLIGDKEATCFQTRADYTSFLRKTYNALVDSYNDALYTLALGRAMKVAKAMRKVKNDLANESIII